MDRAAFFSSIKQSRFKGKMTKAQVTGIEAILDGWDKYGYGLDTACAYELATAYWETGQRMQPVRETFATSTKQAISRLNAAWTKGQMKWVKTPYWRNGWFGRGLVQITHEDNYAGPLRDAVLKEFGVDIHKDPDMALRLDVAVFILIEGVSKGVTLKSDFTAFALEDFINDKGTDYDNARKTVNPGEKSSYGPIGAIARDFELAIRAGRKAAGGEFLGPNGKNLYDGQIHDEVLAVQKLLAAKKYTVGEIDGRWGKLTRTAVIGFRAENDLPNKENITDQDFLAALAMADDQALSGAREATTVADLRAKGSGVIKSADKADWTARVALGLAGTGGIDSALGEAEKYSSYAARAKALISPFTSFAQDNFWVILGGLGIIVIYQLFRAKNKVAEKYANADLSAK